MSVEEFIVTLPSNASVTNFPNNKANSYTVALPKTLTLDGDFEVAVGDLQYPHNWTNFEEEYISVLRVDQSPGEQDHIMHLTSYHERKLDDSKQDSFQEKIRDNIKKDSIYPSKRKFKSYMLKVPTGYYVNAGEIAKIIVTKFNTISEYERLDLQYKYDEATNVLKFTSSNMEWVRILSTKDDLCRILGYGKATKLVNHYIWDPLAEPKRKPQVDEFSTIYLYTDIIKYQIV
ncbi:MAG: hypothetical protein FD143_3736 [Ignavibacteria bacterium]|nr:MAG: hypothetical protein FD143_3736 [Ignavibacteria bacterium]